ncbi:MAG TPA: efflux transporter outer membrane subunit [Quisquiliibacterium sp.]|nr:efflux transporter outer membrane subunit [Quisquiliibacterium sp.]
MRSIRISTRTLSRVRIACASLGACLLLGACADRSGISPSARRAEPAAVGLATASPEFQWPDERWWQRYGDARLDELVDRALADNPSLKAAQSRLDRARSFVDFADASAGPRLDAAITALRQRYSENGLVPASVAGTTASTHVGLLDFSWELDFFGRNRAALQAALGSARAAEAEVQAAKVLLASQVVRSWVELARLQEQRRLARHTLEENEQLLGLVTQRVRAGVDNRVELRRAQGAVPRARAAIEALDGEIALVRNTLAALTAQPTQALAGLEAPLPAAPPSAVPEQIPADLLGRRADVAAARWRIEAAIGARDATSARFYPNVNLVAFAGFSSLGLASWLESGSAVWGVGPAIRLPLFDAGRLRAELRGRTADLDEAVHVYNTAIAEAARDVADQVASLRSLARRDREQRDALAAAEDAHAFAVQRYRAGLDTYRDVRSAQLAVIAERHVSANLAARSVELHAGLARALGGGYQNLEDRTNGSPR